MQCLEHMDAVMSRWQALILQLACPNIYSVELIHQCQDEMLQTLAYAVHSPLQILALHTQKLNGRQAWRQPGANVHVEDEK